MQKANMPLLKRTHERFTFKCGIVSRLPSVGLNTVAKMLGGDVCSFFGFGENFNGLLGLLRVLLSFNTKRKYNKL